MIIGFRGSVITTLVSDSGDLPVSTLNYDLQEIKELNLELQEELNDKVVVMDTSSCYNGVDSFGDLNEIFVKYQKVVSNLETANIYDFTNYFRIEALITPKVNTHVIKSLKVAPEKGVHSCENLKYQRIINVLSKVGKVGVSSLNPLLQDHEEPSDVAIRNWMEVLESGDTISKISNFVEIRESVHRLLNAEIWLQQVTPLTFLYQKSMGCLRFFYVTGFIMPNLFIGFALYDKGPRYVMLTVPKDWRVQRYECFNSKKIQNDISIGDLYFVLSETDTEHDCDLIKIACRNKILSFIGLRGDNLRYGVVRSLLLAIDALLNSSGKSLDLI